MAKDGTVYMGLQDNGEGKIDPDGTAYTIFGGDGFFTAVDPDNADHAYEEYVAGAISSTKDGGKTWTSIAPTNMTDALFSTPFEMDPNDANHLMIGGRQVEETTAGRRHHLRQLEDGLRSRHAEAPGRRKRPGGLRRPRQPALRGRRQLGQGPRQRADRPAHRGLLQDRRRDTLPGGQDLSTGLPVDPLAGTFPPGTYEDTPFTIGAGDGDAAVLIT